jgi:hypothetical protein
VQPGGKRIRQHQRKQIDGIDARKPGFPETRFAREAVDLALVGIGQDEAREQKEQADGEVAIAQKMSPTVEVGDSDAPGQGRRETRPRTTRPENGPRWKQANPSDEWQRLGVAAGTWIVPVTSRETKRHLTRKSDRFIARDPTAGPTGGRSLTGTNSITYGLFVEMRGAQTNPEALPFKGYLESKTISVGRWLTARRCDCGARTGYEDPRRRIHGRY